MHCRRKFSVLYACNKLFADMLFRYTQIVHRDVSGAYVFDSGRGLLSYYTFASAPNKHFKGDKWAIETLKWPHESDKDTRSRTSNAKLYISSDKTTFLALSNDFWAGRGPDGTCVFWRIDMQLQAKQYAIAMPRGFLVCLAKMECCNCDMTRIVFAIEKGIYFLWREECPDQCVRLIVNSVEIQKHISYLVHPESGDTDPKKKKKSKKKRKPEHAAAVSMSNMMVVMSGRGEGLWLLWKLPLFSQFVLAYYVLGDTEEKNALCLRVCKTVTKNRISVFSHSRKSECVYIADETSVVMHTASKSKHALDYVIIEKLMWSIPRLPNRNGSCIMRDRSGELYFVLNGERVYVGAVLLNSDKTAVIAPHRGRTNNGIGVVHQHIKPECLCIYYADMDAHMNFVETRVVFQRKTLSDTYK